MAKQSAGIRCYRREVKIMRGVYKSQHPFVWFEESGWWFKVFGECFGPYPELPEARYNLLVIQGLSQQLRQAIAK